MEQKLKVLRILHLALIGQALFMYFIFGEIDKLRFLDFKEVEGPAYMMLIVPLGAVFASDFLYKNLLKKVDRNSTADQKVQHYMVACILRWAVIEGSIFFLLFMEDFILVGLMLIGYLAFIGPSKDKMEQDIESVNF